MSGSLTIVATPIGNLDDLSPRAARTLSDADVIACEDTRVTRKLFARLPDRPRARLLSVHARNEAARAAEIVRAVQAGSQVALVSDAGMPGLSDPGHRVVAACAKAGLRIEVIPGPSAVPAALIVSGLPTARFVFDGFLPRGNAAREARLAELAAERRTIVVFESPRRVATTLRAMLAAFGDRRAALVREISKIHEEVIRERLQVLAERAAAAEVRGEVTIVVEGAPEQAAPRADEGELAAAVADLVARGEVKKEAIATVARAQGVPKRTVYQAVLDHPPR